LAIDNEEWAVEDCRENIERNHADQVIDVIFADTMNVVTQTYDIMLANINRNVIMKKYAVLAHFRPDRGRFGS
jgi:ribosomal protein L11 methyltransferase